jgi:hypothetical protein
MPGGIAETGVRRREGRRAPSPRHIRIIRLCRISSHFGLLYAARSCRINKK